MIKRDGVREGSSSEGVFVPLADSEGWEDTEERMPESMAIPSVPTGRQGHFCELIHFDAMGTYLPHPRTVKVMSPPFCLPFDI